MGFRVLGFGNLWGLDSRVYGQWGFRVSLPAFFGGGLRVELKEDTGAVGFIDVWA